jgi:integrase
MRQPYLVYPRRSGLKEKSYYIAFWSPDARSYSRRSAASLIELLGERAQHISPSTRAGADAAARMALESGILTSSEAHLAGYLSSFWADDGEYAQAKRLAGRPLSAMYLANMRSAIELYVLPWLRETDQDRLPLYKVTRSLVEALVVHLAETTSLSPGRINGIRKAVVVPLSRATDLGQLQRNSASKALQLPEPKKHRMLLSPAEVQAFFGKLTDPRHRTINLLAATTGLRMGECRGLRHGDVRRQELAVDGKKVIYHYLALRHNWVEGEGSKHPKDDYAKLQDEELYDEIPLPAGAARALEELIAANPWGNDFVFWSRLRESPLSKSEVEDVYNRALADIRIPEDERRRRRLGFHAWRHFYNTFALRRLEDKDLRKVTRHKSEAMTERYTQLTDDQRLRLVGVAETLPTLAAKTESSLAD